MVRMKFDEYMTCMIQVKYIYTVNLINLRKLSTVASNCKFIKRKIHKNGKSAEYNTGLTS